MKNKNTEYILELENIKNSSIIIDDDIFNNLKINNSFIQEIGENHLRLKSVFFDKEHQVPNVIRYSLYKTESNSYIIKSDIKKDVFNSNFNDKKINITSFLILNKPIIVIILESPHKDEFDLNFSPKGPAQGLTGVQLCEKLEGVINKHLSILNLTEEEYKIAIINPVPVQTSLYHLIQRPLKNIEINKLRDKLWNILWNEETLKFKAKFVSLISDTNVKIIINACTSKYKKLISDDIKLFSDKHFTVNHPSNWIEKDVNSINLNVISDDK